MSFLNLPNKENVLILNTPNRQEILKDGPTTSQIKYNLLGRGAYGTVIKAIYKGKPVALKIIKNKEDVNKQMMSNESHILGWQHPNIVKILRIESTASFAIVVMERFDGQCLQSVLDTTEVAITHRINIALDIIAALRYCHKNKLLHMDVKPQNVMIFMEKPQPLVAKQNHHPRPFTCKLCDFGSSRHISLGKVCTTKGSVKGTLRYMAPEALKEEFLTPATDVFSLGITLWQIKFRHFPYYWLECNEVVAYQVVKTNLRPNSRELSYGKQLHSKIQKQSCECEQYSTPLSSQSLENLLNLLHENACQIGEDHRQIEAVHPKNKTSLNVFGCTMNSENVNAKRDLHCEFTLSETCTLPAIHLADGAPNYQSLHEHEYVERAERAERLYEEIFISCWHSDFKQRPTTSSLYKQFQKLLLYIH